MTTIGWIRHGITDWNVERRVQGQTDIPLNETGRSQARALAKRLKQERWDIIYSSDLIRAKETAEIAAEQMGLWVITDARLRELAFGGLEGTTPEERLTRYGEDWEHQDFGKEDPESAVRRSFSFVEDVLERHSGEKVLVVSHGALIANTLKRLVPHEQLDTHLRNTSVTILHFRDQDWVCEIYNCSQHLQ